MIVVFFYWKY